MHRYVCLSCFPSLPLVGFLCPKRKYNHLFCVEHKTRSGWEELELELPRPINNNDITAEQKSVLGVYSPHLRRCSVV